MNTVAALEKDPAAEPRAELTHQSSWRFTLGNRDAQIVLKALGGRLEGDEWVKAARDLGNRLTALRVQHLEACVEQASVLRLNLETAAGKTVEEIIREKR